MTLRKYQLFWGIYLQWAKQFASDEEAIAEARETMRTESGWELIRQEVVLRCEHAN